MKKFFWGIILAIINHEEYEICWLHIISDERT